MIHLFNPFVSLLCFLIDENVSSIWVFFQKTNHFLIAWNILLHILERNVIMVLRIEIITKLYYASIGSQSVIITKQIWGVCVELYNCPWSCI